MTRLRTVLASAAILALAACDTQDVQGIQQRVELKPFGSCSELEGYIKDQAIREMRFQLEQDLQSQLNSPGYYGSPDAGMAAADAGTSSPSRPRGSTDSSSGPSAHTETNNQVAGVDEPDFVKNDGKRIFVLSGSNLYATRSWPPAALKLVGKLKLSGQPTQMLMDRDRLSIFTTTSSYDPATGRYATATTITLVDVSKMDAPRVTAVFTFPGRYKSARMVGSVVRLVLVDNVYWPRGVQLYLPWRYNVPEDEIRAELDRIARKNERLIRAQPLSQWVSTPYYEPVGGSRKTLAYRCTDFYRPNTPIKLGLTTIVTFDLNRPDQMPGRMSVMGKTDEIYASRQSLYLASRHWWWEQRSGNLDHTYLHKLDISDPRRTRYVASGGVDGTPLNQFAMDEHKGFLRIATTTSVREERGDFWRSVKTLNQVVVMQEKAGRLLEVGRTPPLAEGERLYAVRFLGDRGFLVTFKQVDPLFTLDLSDPTHPRAVGKLKVPGYSTYIHPLGSDHLLTMGVYIPEPDAHGRTDWSQYSLKLSIFDVRDFAHPRETFTQKVGSVSSSSEAVHEHKAFTYFAEKGLLAIPFTDYRYGYSGSDYWNSFTSELKVFKVSTSTGFTPMGALSMKDLYRKQGRTYWGWGYSSWVRRSIMASDAAGKDYVYAISDLGIRVAEATALDRPLATAEFKSQTSTP